MKHFNKLLMGMTALAGSALFLTAVTANADTNSASSSLTSTASSTTSIHLNSASSNASYSSNSVAGSSKDSSTTSSSSTDRPDLGDYDIESATQYRLRTVNTDGETFWSQPYSKGATANGTATDGQLVKLNRVATDGDNTYFEVYGLGPTQGGKILGWINANALSMTSDYELPFTYSSQLYPTYAPDACEAISLKMILSVRGLATNVANKDFIDGIPRSSNPNYGYTADPYRHGSHATIYPIALARYAKKWTNNVYDITGASLTKLIYEIRHGNPVVFEGSWRMQQTKSDHILALVGYKPGYFKIADPYMRVNSKNKVFWTSTSNFMSLFNTPVRGSRAIVLK